MTSDDRSLFDHHMMGVALAMARRGLGTTAPNPSVGSIVVDEGAGEVIARGFTQAGGRPHAEVEALRRAGERARGATMYVTLEPCSHVGQTPPCCEAIVAAGISRVVCGVTDPDPRVSGRGLRWLRNAGVDVESGVRLAETRQAARGHILRVSERRPFVQLKMALDQSGHIARGSGERPVWVTGETARAHGHMLRAQCDAIVVGSGTVEADDPELTCRLPGLAACSPIRVVLAGKTLPDLQTKLVQSAGVVPVIIVTGPGADQRRVVALERAGCGVIQTGTVGGRLWLPAVCEALIGRGVTRCLIEGGPMLWRGFSEAGLVDEVVVYAASSESCVGERLDAVVKAVLNFAPRLRLQHIETRSLGKDDMFVFETQ